MEEEIVKPKRGRKKVELTEEERYLFMSTVNTKLAKKIQMICDKDGIKIVELLADPGNGFRNLLNTLYDGKKSEKEKAKEFMDFVLKDKNRKSAAEKAIDVFMLITKGAIPITEANRKTYNIGDIMRNVQISSVEAKQILTLLYAFGYISFEKKDKVFRFSFTSDNSSSIILEDIKNNIASLNVNIARYWASVEENNELNREDKGRKIDELYNLIRSTIVV